MAYRMLLCLAVAALLPRSGFAQDITWEPPPAPKIPKIESSLVERLIAARAKPSAGAGAEEVIVLLEPEAGQLASSIDRIALATTRARVVAESQHLLRVSVPVSAMEAVSQVPGVAFIRRPYHPTPSVVVSEGVDRIAAPAAHSRGVTGQRVKVAIIDGGFMGADALPNDMPATWRYLDYTRTGIYSGDNPHGTACAEIVHDVAPDAELLLVKIDDLLDFENAKNLCVREGSQIVNYSTTWLGTGFGDGEGLACDIVDDAADHGILWVNAAGNYAQKQYTGLWADPDSDGFHNFGANDEVLDLVDVAAGEQIEAYLTWNDWPSSTNDYDLYLCRVGATGQVTYVASSTDYQRGNSPVEHVQYYVPERGRYGVAVKKMPAARTTLLKIWVSHRIDEDYASLVGTIAVPADARGALAVGAADQAQWPRSSFSLEAYSSQGPTVDGRVKPDIIGPTWVSTASYGSYGFLGTSAAAPHVAGVAALIKSVNPSYTLQQLTNALTSAAVDVGDPGKDNMFGYGKLMVPYLSNVTAPVAGFQTSATSGTAPLTVTFTNTTTGSAASYAWSFGDGGTSTAVNPSHTFIAAGTYTVTLTATNNGGSNSSSLLSALRGWPI